MNYFVTEKQLFFHVMNIIYAFHCTPIPIFPKTIWLRFLLSIIICLAGGKEIKDCNCFHAILFNMNILSITTFLWRYMTSSFGFYTYIFYFLWFMLCAQSPIKPKTNYRHRLWNYLFFENFFWSIFLFFTCIPCEIEFFRLLPPEKKS